MGGWLCRASSPPIRGYDDGLSNPTRNARIRVEAALRKSADNRQLVRAVRSDNDWWSWAIIGGSVAFALVAFWTAALFGSGGM